MQRTAAVESFSMQAHLPLTQEEMRKWFEPSVGASTQRWFAPL